MIEPITAEQIESDFAIARYHMGLRAARKSDRIILMTARKHEITVEQIKSMSRKREFAWPRQECMYRMRRETSLSLPQIGRIFDRDHTTVIHAIRAVERRRASLEVVA